MPLFTVSSSSHCAPGRRMGKGLGEREAAILYTTKEKEKLLYSIQLGEREAAIFHNNMLLLECLVLEMEE